MHITASKLIAAIPKVQRVPKRLRARCTVTGEDGKSHCASAWLLIKAGLPEDELEQHFYGLRAGGSGPHTITPEARAIIDGVMDRWDNLLVWPTVREARAIVKDYRRKR